MNVKVRQLFLFLTCLEIYHICHYSRFPSRSIPSPNTPLLLVLVSLSPHSLPLIPLPCISPHSPLPLLISFFIFNHLRNFTGHFKFYSGYKYHFSFKSWYLNLLQFYGKMNYKFILIDRERKISLIMLYRKSQIF